ncbi:MAG: hypothetical protein ACD_2C00021G0005 [uncultured bacterium (gcode 4)]|uniref:Uncharacterized protein n=1 Tax=uncultured bacterium (gcode 4) TaxID=1234023 RepID=K2G7A6_9BACT|nr:MAG: hypothetical protein ACD_2C00021G0005 [uncultured bacterium (gcode 4)]
MLTTKQIFRALKFQDIAPSNLTPLTEKTGETSVKVALVLNWKEVEFVV